MGKDRNLRWLGLCRRENKKIIIKSDTNTSKQPCSFSHYYDYNDNSQAVQLWIRKSVRLRADRLRFLGSYSFFCFFHVFFLWVIDVEAHAAAPIDQLHYHHHNEALYKSYRSNQIPINCKWPVGWSDPYYVANDLSDRASCLSSPRTSVYCERAALPAVCAFPLYAY